MRGCDMKGFIACASVPWFKARKLRERFHIVISYDGGGLHWRPPADRAAWPRPARPRASASRPAHKRMDIGREAHSSMPEIGVNAIDAAAALIGELERIGAERPPGRTMRASSRPTRP